jgi:hypothetical protein
MGEDPTDIEDDLLDAHLFHIEAAPKDLEEIEKKLEEGKAPEDLPANKKKVLALKETPFTIMNGYLYKLGPDDVLRRCTLENERESIIDEAHAGTDWRSLPGQHNNPKDTPGGSLVADPAQRLSGTSEKM